MTSSNDFDLLVNLDYKTRETHATLVNPYLTGDFVGASDQILRMYDEKGCVIHRMQLGHSPATYHSQILNASAPFGLRFGSNAATDPIGGYDSSINRVDTSGVSVPYLLTMWEMSNEFNVLDTVSDLENGIRDTNYVDIDRRDGCYIDVPLLITGGDAVIQGIVATVTGETDMSLTYDRSILSYTGSSIGDAICEVISGANEGQTFSVRAHTLGSSDLSVDRDVTHLSGQIVKVMPYRIVDSYSGWTYTGSTTSNMGEGGMRARFGLDVDIPAGPGSIHYLSGTYSGIAAVAHPLDVLQAPVFTASVVALMSDPYMRDVRVGDVVYYTPASAPSAEFTGFVVSTTSSHGVPAEGDYTISIWPEEAPTATSEYKIFRKNLVDLQVYPELDREYLCVTRSTNDMIVNTGVKYSTKVKTPSVTVDFAANEFESMFPSIPETSHFHIGPIHLSNGQTLLDDGVGENNVPPYLLFSGLVTNGDPEAPATILEKEAFSTQNADAAHKFNGAYYKDGVMTLAASTSFNASETIICKTVIRYGSIKIDRVFTIPVQPSV
tara:strand:+ start:96849 stop:98501 length:1653 start_codon:yes stop_codon:yes gene_type:complete